MSVQFTSNFKGGVRMENCLIYILNEHSVGFISLQFNEMSKILY